MGGPYFVNFLKPSTITYLENYNIKTLKIETETETKVENDGSIKIYLGNKERITRIDKKEFIEFYDKDYGSSWIIDDKDYNKETILPIIKTNIETNITNKSLDFSRIKIYVENYVNNNKLFTRYEKKISEETKQETLSFLRLLCMRADTLHDFFTHKRIVVKETDKDIKVNQNDLLITLDSTIYLNELFLKKLFIKIINKLDIDFTQRYLWCLNFEYILKYTIGSDMWDKGVSDAENPYSRHGDSVSYEARVGFFVKFIFEKVFGQNSLYFSKNFLEYNVIKNVFGNEVKFIVDVFDSGALVQRQKLIDFPKYNVLNVDKETKEFYVSVLNLWDSASYDVNFEFDNDNFECKSSDDNLENSYTAISASYDIKKAKGNKFNCIITPNPPYYVELSSIKEKELIDIEKRSTSIANIVTAIFSKESKIYNENIFNRKINLDCAILYEIKRTGDGFQRLLTYELNKKEKDIKHVLLTGDLLNFIQAQLTGLPVIYTPMASIYNAYYDHNYNCKNNYCSVFERTLISKDKLYIGADLYDSKIESKYRYHRIYDVEALDSPCECCGSRSSPIQCEVCTKFYHIDCSYNNSVKGLNIAEKTFYDNCFTFKNGEKVIKSNLKFKCRVCRSRKEIDDIIEERVCKLCSGGDTNNPIKCSVEFCNRYFHKNCLEVFKEKYIKKLPTSSSKSKYGFITKNEFLICPVCFFKDKDKDNFIQTLNKKIQSDTYSDSANIEYHNKVKKVFENLSKVIDGTSINDVKQLILTKDDINMETDTYTQIDSEQIPESITSIIDYLLIEISKENQNTPPIQTKIKELATNSKTINSYKNQIITYIKNYEGNSKLLVYRIITRLMPLQLQLPGNFKRKRLSSEEIESVIPEKRPILNMQTGGESRDNILVDELNQKDLCDYIAKKASDIYTLKNSLIELDKKSFIFIFWKFIYELGWKYIFEKINDDYKINLWSEIDLKEKLLNLRYIDLLDIFKNLSILDLEFVNEDKKISIGLNKISLTDMTDLTNFLNSILTKVLYLYDTNYTFNYYLYKLIKEEGDNIYDPEEYYINPEKYNEEIDNKKITIDNFIKSKITNDTNLYNIYSKFFGEYFSLNSNDYNHDEYHITGKEGISLNANSVLVKQVNEVQPLKRSISINTSSRENSTIGNSTTGNSTTGKSTIGGNLKLKDYHSRYYKKYEKYYY